MGNVRGWVLATTLMITVRHTFSQSRAVMQIRSLRQVGGWLMHCAEGTGESQRRRRQQLSSNRSQVTEVAREGG